MISYNCFYTGLDESKTSLVAVVYIHPQPAAKSNNVVLLIILLLEPTPTYSNLLELALKLLRKILNISITMQAAKEETFPSEGIAPACSVCSGSSTSSCWV